MVYMGSKRRIAKHILPIILKNRKEGQWYVEPFCGGCNSINKVDGNRLAADSNEYLISLYKALQSGWQPNECYTREEYQYCKNNMGIMPKHEVGYIGFVCSFSGKFFNGYAEYPDRYKNRKERLEQLRNNLLINFDPNIQYIHSRYDELHIPENSIIYCDPPYQGTTGYKTGLFDHDKFWQWCRDKKEEGHTVFVSEYQAPIDLKCVWSMDIKDTLSTSKTHIKTEKLFTI